MLGSNGSSAISILASLYSRPAYWVLRPASVHPRPPCRGAQTSLADLQGPTTQEGGTHQLARRSEQLMMRGRDEAARFDARIDSLAQITNPAIVWVDILYLVCLRAARGGANGLD